MEVIQMTACGKKVLSYSTFLYQVFWKVSEDGEIQNVHNFCSKT